MSTSNINCPKCGQSIDIQGSIYEKIKNELDLDYSKKIIQFQGEFEKKHKEITKREERVSELIEKGVNEKISFERLTLEKRIRAQLELEKSDEISSYKQQLEEKSKTTKELNKLKAEYERLKREKSEMKESLEAEMEEKLNDSLKSEKHKFIQEQESRNKMKLAEKEHVINQLKEQLEIAQRKAQQGSMQIQGEVQEIAIEEYLKDAFPMDKISEIKKGVRGGDCLHTVLSMFSEECGSIYYESKRTKDFQPSWIDKFKKDMRDKKALYGVIVSECYPKGTERMTNIKGVWVCSYDEFLGISHILRESILAVHNVIAAQENKGSKMETLYTYLTGTEFKSHLEAIVEGFSQMQDDVNKERKAMESLWKQREKQISKVVINTGQLYGSIRGIAGNAIGHIKRLELPDSDNA